MDKEQVIKLLDDLLEQHELATDDWIREFAGSEHDKLRQLGEHLRYKERVRLAKEYLNKTL